MNKILLHFVFFFFVCSGCSLFADDIRLEVRSAAFFHSSKLFRHIYGTVGADYQIQASTKFSNCLETWSNLDWFSKRGRSVGFKDPTRVRIFNWSLGINYLYDLNCWHTLYVGVGPSLAKVWIKDKSCHEDDKDSKTVLGGVVKCGIYTCITDCAFLDLFVDYLYQPAHLHNHVDMGGVKTGIGIGVKF